NFLIAKDEIHTPVKTWCVFPDSSVNIRIASFRSAGLFRIEPLMTTIVSAVTTTSFSLASKKSAFFSARNNGTSSAYIEAGKSSSTSGFRTSKTKPASRMRNWRRGELEARIRWCLKFILHDRPEDKSTNNLRIKVGRLLGHGVTAVADPHHVVD